MPVPPIKDWISCRNLREDHCTIKVIWPVLAISPNGQVTHCMVDPVEETSKSVFIFVSCKISMDSLPLLIYRVCRLRLQVAVVFPVTQIETTAKVAYYVPRPQIPF